MPEQVCQGRRVEKRRLWWPDAGSLNMDVHNKLLKISPF